jgi:hypothetical protein
MAGSARHSLPVLRRFHARRSLPVLAAGARCRYSLAGALALSAACEAACRWA